MTQTVPTRPRRRVATALAAASLTPVLLSGCAVFSPVQTDVDYQAADGVNVGYGDLKVRGLVVISNAPKSPGTIVGQFINSGTSDIDVAFSSKSSKPVTLTVKPGRSTTLGEGEALVLSSVDVAPGEVLPVTITTASTGANMVETPVLPAIEYYEGDKPPGAPPAPESTPEPSSDDHGDERGADAGLSESPSSH